MFKSIEIKIDKRNRNTISCKSCSMTIFLFSTFKDLILSYCADRENALGRRVLEKVGRHPPA